MRRLIGVRRFYLDCYCLVGVRNMETGFAIFTLAVTGLLLGMIHMTRQAEQQRKAELVPVRIKRKSLR